LSDESSVIAAAGLGAFLGHLYPLYFGFKGGKGVATALGALIGFSWISGLMAIATWLAMALTFRISSLSALTTFAAAPLYLWLVTSDQTLLGSMIAISVMLFWRHRSNIRDLLQGKEGRIGKRDNGK
jgi:glycerol-3-phosphate acyltransferase PlsY